MNFTIQDFQVRTLKSCCHNRRTNWAREAYVHAPVIGKSRNRRISRRLGIYLQSESRHTFSTWIPFLKIKFRFYVKVIAF